MSFRLTEAADADIEAILRDTLQLFGPMQLQAYSTLIELALERVGADPLGLGTADRDDIGPGVRSLHIDTVATRRGSASHSLYFLSTIDGTERVAVVLRVLHNRMEPRSRVASAIPDQAP
ncbi:type II toxin-antitoxin system RelE/ParE family toxin [Aurantimonas sp. HBX-1]|uniref:type II toxin-antitoxin system RelE/ParE family toxin n=1 Tax=Aurantimonas sp. HBX-1 TaxID=2906072 RepID=UPI00351CE948